MPFVKVGPRSFGGMPSRKAPFSVNVEKLRCAFIWLRANNLWYRDVEWREDWAKEWTVEDVDVGTTRDEDVQNGEDLVINKDSFESWMQLVRQHVSSENDGFGLGRRIQELIHSVRNADDDQDDVQNDWNVLRSMAADALGSSFHRVAGTLSRDVLASVLYSHRALDIGDATHMSVNDLKATLRQWPENDLPEEILRLHSEMLLAGEDAGKDAPLEHTGALSRFPEVEDSPVAAIREDTPGYIARAFPKLFPHGTGDFHCGQGGRTAVNSRHRLLTFSQWGRFVMTWHDGRFARHTRFRYWLVDTSLRSMAPQLQHTFLKTHAAAKNYTLQDLEDPVKRRDLVGQMSRSTSPMAGSVGERRNMRQKLDSMVNQIEAETADQKENGGQGRIPGGFCTLTCPVYKWQQLFDVVLQSYPSGSPEDPNALEHYTTWKSMPFNSERKIAMRQAFYRLSVDNPAVVQWYCSLKLEMALHLVVDLVSRQLKSADVPGFELTKERVRNNLEQKLQTRVSVDDASFPDLRHFGHVDDYWLSYEWSDGGIIHAHIALWITFAIRTLNTWVSLLLIC